MGKQISIQEIKQTELGILHYIDRVCQANGLRYVLAYGTLLGAVRHQGFIPWDDDIDIMMPREDYKRFLDITHKTTDSRYVTASMEHTKGYYYEFAKVYDNRTRIEEKGVTAIDGMGVYVDIFPMDYRPKHYAWHKTRIDILRRLKVAAVWTELPRTNPIIKPLVWLVWKTASKTGYAYFLQKMQRIVTRTASTPSDSLVFYLACNRISYPADMFDKREYASFETTENRGGRFPIPACYNACLTAEYGADYMQLPPEDKRIVHGFYAEWAAA